MSKSSMSVSVVIPCFNCAITITRAVESIIAQTRVPNEIIIIDDASNDDSPNVLRGLVENHANKVNFKLISLTKNVGVASARNIGWNAATSELIAFLDGDDSWFPRKIELQIALFEDNKKLMVCGAKHSIIFNQFTEDGIDEEFRYKEITFKSILWRNSFITSSVVLKSKLSYRFKERQRHMEDHQLWMKIAAQGLQIVCINTPLVAHHKYDYGESGLSGELLNMELSELRNYYELLMNHQVGIFLFISLIIWSILKCFRRIVIVGIRHFFHK